MVHDGDEAFIFHVMPVGSSPEPEPHNHLCISHCHSSHVSTMCPGSHRRQCHLGGAARTRHARRGCSEHVRHQTRQPVR
jgi:hypothetical protein